MTPESALAAETSAFLEVSPRFGGLLVLGGVRLEIPAGAVDRPVRLSVARLLTPASLHPGLANATAGGGAYRFEPRGQRFVRPVRVSLPFDPGLSASETALSNLFTYFYEEDQRRWVRLPRVELDLERSRVVSLTTHFTDLINATLELPEGPAPILRHSRSRCACRLGGGALMPSNNQDLRIIAHFFSDPNLLAITTPHIHSAKTRRCG